MTLGGRRVPVRRPRVRSADGACELPVAAYEHFSSTEVLSRLAMDKMLAKLSTCRYRSGLEPVGERVEASASSTSRSTVSWRFVEATEHALAELLAGDLSKLDLAVLMIDGVHFGDHVCVVAMGIDLTGKKHPLSITEGDTENATVVRDLLVGLRDRGLEVTRPILVVIDGAKALASAVKAVLDHPVIHRCQLHKIRNVESKLPKTLAKTVTAKMRSIYHYDDALRAEAELEELARQLQKSHPGAAGSLREGLTETLTVMALKVPPTLSRTLRSTNAIESMIEICRDHSANVKRWRDGQMALRWCAAGMVEAEKQFRKVNGFLHLPALRTALDDYVEAVSHRSSTTRRTPLEHHRAAAEVLRNSGHPRLSCGPPFVTGQDATICHSWPPSAMARLALLSRRCDPLARGVIPGQFWKIAQLLLGASGGRGRVAPSLQT